VRCPGFEGVPVFTAQSQSQAESKWFMRHCCKRLEERREEGVKMRMDMSGEGLAFVPVETCSQAEAGCGFLHGKYF
jgi:hypothetical protein